MIDAMAGHVFLDSGDVQAAMARRDAADSSRAVSPLRSADDALHIDTTGRTPEAIARSDAALLAAGSVVRGPAAAVAGRWPGR